MLTHMQPFCCPIDAKPTGASTLTLNLSLPAGRYVRIDWGDGNQTTVTGAVWQNYSNAYAGAGTFPIKLYGDFRFLTRFQVLSVAVDGTLKRIAALSGPLTFIAGGDNTISGDIAYLPSNLVYLGILGQTTLFGDIAHLPSGLAYLNCCGLNTISDYSGKTWTTKPVTFTLIPTGAGGLSTAEIDQLLIDFDDDLIWAAGNIITLTGTNAARSAASDAAVTSLQSEGVTVTTN